MMPRGFHELKDRLLGLRFAWRNRGGGGGDDFVQGADAAQNALDLFPGQWVSAFPPTLGLRAGKHPLFDDPRLAWMARQAPVAGKRVLELGPLEGAHTYALLQMGAAHVTAIESNRNAFLKCLVAGSVLGLSRARFLCADGMAWLEQNPQSFDLCVASGILYHLRDPLRLLGLVCARAGAVYLWTHYYDSERLRANPAQAYRFGEARPMEWQGFCAMGIRRRYGAQRRNPLHLGGQAAYSYWLTRADILRALHFFGRKDIVIGHEEPDHPAGPAFAVVAR